MTSTEITYDEDGYTLTPQGQAWKLFVSGDEPATQADRDWFEAFNSEARHEEILAEIEAEAERTDQGNCGIPWTDSPDQYPAGRYRNGPGRTWPFPAAHNDPAARPQAEPEAEA
jgi:hypothetical protein